MSNVVLKLAENVATLGVKTAYGQPVDVDGVKIVPVALVQFGFGAGGEEDEGGQGQSAGGGGGFTVPIGAYVTENGRARFEPNIVSLLAVGIPFVWVAGHAVARVIKAFKK